jgi:polar amino acid transport system substrate-binding protein
VSSKFSASGGHASGTAPLTQAREELAPTGVLRAGINMGNFLLVTGRDNAGNPKGVAPSVAGEAARRLGVPLQLVPYPSPGALADAAGTEAWDIGLIGADPLRAEKISFTAPYCEIEATYMVPSGSPINNVGELDRPGMRIAVSARSAYELWLRRNIHHATLVHADGPEAALQLYFTEKLDALAALRPGLLIEQIRAPGHRVLDGRFMSVQQAIGLGKGKPSAEAFLHDLVEDAKSSGLIALFIAEHGVKGLSVAPPA